MNILFVASNRIPYCIHAEITNCMSAVTFMSLEPSSGVCDSFPVLIVIY